MAKWTNYYKIITPATDAVKIVDNQAIGDAGTYGNYTWYQRLVQGSATRLTRYREYDLMDNDVEIARALDTIAEEMTGNNPRTGMPLEINTTVGDGEISNNATLTFQTALRHWCEMHDWKNRIFDVARTLAKFGDCFFRVNLDTGKWTFVHPKTVVGAIVDADDITNILGWQIMSDTKKAKHGIGSPSIGSQSSVDVVPKSEIIRFTLNNDMDDNAPFGESVLRPIVKSHKQKELLEDAIIIYRVQRAPERRVFYIDVGKMPSARVKTYLETIKNEIKQKNVPSQAGGKSQIDSVYNPQSMSQDFFFAQRADGKGSRVDTLPGGQGLGELSDLEYFQSKVFRGLRIPSSYMKEGGEGAVFGDGKVGVAYIQELRFALYIQRLQGHIESIMDLEFKKYLRDVNVRVDPGVFDIKLPSPSNFGTYRQQEIDAALLSTFSAADGIDYMSKRFKMKKYLQLTPEEIAENEESLREEMGLSRTNSTIPVLYGNEEMSSGEDESSQPNITPDDILDVE